MVNQWSLVVSQAASEHHMKGIVGIGIGGDDCELAMRSTNAEYDCRNGAESRVNSQSIRDRYEI